MKAAVLILLCFVIVEEVESQCVTRRTVWGQFGSFFTDPICDVWCRMRNCGEGNCIENRGTHGRASCVCERCYTDEDGNLHYTSYDDIRGQDYTNGYRGQNSFNRDNYDYNNNNDNNNHNNN